MLTPPSDVRDLAKVDGAQSIDPTKRCPSCGLGGEGKSTALFGPNDTARLSSSSQELPFRLLYEHIYFRTDYRTESSS